MQGLLHDGLLSTQHIRHAAIVRRKDRMIKAKSGGFDLQAQEISTLESAFSHPKEERDAAIRISDTAYLPVRLDSLSLYGKNQDKGGVVVARTETFYIIGTYDQGMQPGVAVEAVEKLADYFRSKNK